MAINREAVSVVPPGQKRYFPSYTDLKFQDSSTPTIFLNFNAVGSSGVGTLANPCTTWAQVQTAITALGGTTTNVVPGTVLGIKSGTHSYNTQGNAIKTIAGGFSKLIASGDRTNLFRIVPYGGSAPAILDGTMSLTGWTNEGGGVYSRDMSTENPVTKLRMPLWESGVRMHTASATTTLTAAQALSAVQAQSAGYYYHAISGTDNKLYVWPNSVGSLENGDMKSSGAQRLLDWKLVDTRDAGYMSISGIQMIGAMSEALFYQFNATTNILGTPGNSSVSNIYIMGNKFSQTGCELQTASSGTSDHICGYLGASDAVRSKASYVGGNYFYDACQNACELSGTDGLVSEYNTCQLSHFMEFWSSNSNAAVRYNKHYNASANFTVDTGFNKYKSAWVAPYKLTDSTAKTTTTDTTVSNGHSFHDNIFNTDTPLIIAAGSGHVVHHNTLLTPGLVSTGVPIELGDTSNAPGMTGCDVSNNIMYQAYTTGTLAWIRTNCGGLTGDNNCYIANGSKAKAGALFTKADNSQISAGGGFGDGVSWYTTLTSTWASYVNTTFGNGYDANSRISNDNLRGMDSDYVPSRSSLCWGAGGDLGYAKDIYGNARPAHRPCAGAVELI